MTIQEMIKGIEQELFEISGRRRAAIMLGVHIPSGDTTRARELETQLRRAQDAVAAERQRAVLEARRRPIADVLMPRAGYWRPFMRSLADDTVDLLARWGVQVAYSARNPRALRHLGTIYVPMATTEASIATILHEAAHVVYPPADSEQQRHRLCESSIVSAVAECYAWQFASTRALLWTDDMQRQMTESLVTYRRGSSGPEEQLIAETIAKCNSLVRPAPDTLEGRIRRVQQIRREQTIRELSANPSLERCERRLAEIAREESSYAQR